MEISIHKGFSSRLHVFFRDVKMTVASKSELVNQVKVINYDQKMKKIIQARRDFLIKKLNRESSITKQLMQEFSE